MAAAAQVRGTRVVLLLIIVKKGAARGRRLVALYTRRRSFPVGIDVGPSTRQTGIRERDRRKEGVLERVRD